MTGKTYDKKNNSNDMPFYAQLWSTFYWRRLIVTTPIYVLVLFVVPNSWFNLDDNFFTLYHTYLMIGYVVCMEMLVSLFNCISIVFQKLFRFAIKQWYDTKLWFGRSSDRFGFLAIGLSMAAATWGVSKIAPEAEALQWFLLMPLYCLSWSIFATAVVIIGRLESPESALTP